MGVSLEDFRNLLMVDKTYFSVGVVQRLFMASDRSFLKVECRIISEGDERNVIARMTWNSVGPEAGDFQIPSVGDMLLIAYVDADPSQAMVLTRFSSTEDKIPANAVEGDRVIKSLAGRNMWITGQNNLYLTKTDAVPTENLVLGQVFKQWASDLITQIEALMDALQAETHTSGPPGMATTPPINAADYASIKTALTALKDSPIGDDAVLSSYALTYKE